MASELTFDDIFQDDVEEVAAFAKAKYSTPYPPSQNSSFIVSSTLLGVILALAIYWAVSFTLSVRQKLRREANELYVFSFLTACFFFTFSHSISQSPRHAIPYHTKHPSPV